MQFDAVRNNVREARDIEVGLGEARYPIQCVSMVRTFFEVFWSRTQHGKTWKHLGRRQNVVFRCVILVSPCCTPEHEESQLALDDHSEVLIVSVRATSSFALHAVQVSHHHVTKMCIERWKCS